MNESGDSKDLLTEEMGKCSGEPGTKEQGNENHIVRIINKFFFFFVSYNLVLRCVVCVIVHTSEKRM